MAPCGRVYCPGEILRFTEPVFNSIIASSFPGGCCPYTVTTPVRPLGAITASCGPTPTGMNRMLSVRRSISEAFSDRWFATST